MKKYIIPTLASALIVPGLGQVLNRQVKKGLLIMAGVFILLLACLYRLVVLAMSLLETLAPEEINYDIITSKLHDQDLNPLWIIIIAFILLWVFAIIDAFIVGVRLEKKESGEAK